jgi:Fur family ferric uptake transcriptional regulator
MLHTDTYSQRVIRQRGYRFTPQRQMVMDALRELKGHRTPDEVFARVQLKTTAINRATVYRTLEFMLRMGLVTVAQIKDNQTVYEIVDAEPHHHLVCQRCDKVEMLEHKAVLPMFNRIERENGFRVRTDHLMLFGVCQACLKKEQEA